MSVVVLLSAAFGLLAALGAGAALFALARTLPALTRRWPPSSTALRATLVLGPAILAFLVLVAILAPNPLDPCHCAIHELHHPHLCLYHPDLARPLLAPALVLMGLWVAIAAPRLARVLREIISGERFAARLRRLPARHFDGFELRIAEGLGLGAFTIGIRRPIVVFDTRLWGRLSVEERRAVLHHERAHVARRDTLTLAVLRIASAVTQWPLSEAWVRAWKAASEAVCDRHAARALGDPGLVAEALVSVERIRATSAPFAHVAAGLGIAAKSDLEERVRALLETEDAPRPLPLASDLAAVGVALSGVVALVVVWPGDSFHHVTESLLGLFIR